MDNRGSTDAQSYPLAARSAKSERTVIDISGAKIGGDDFVILAGPCSVEDEWQVMETARVVAQAGCKFLRGGVFKPRTSPYSFQGLGSKGLELIRKAADVHGLRLVTELMDCEDIHAVADAADVIQLGSRSMMNYALLKKVGRLGKPVLLKRNMAARIEEFLMAAEYLLVEGCCDVILCERGIVSIDPFLTRNTLDLAAVPLLKLLSHLPVIVDPSHGGGLRELVPSLARGAVAVGAHGLLVELHPSPDEALCDGRQSLDIPTFEVLVRDLQRLHACTKELSEVI